MAKPICAGASIWNRSLLFRETYCFLFDVFIRLWKDLEINALRFPLYVRF